MAAIWVKQVLRMNEGTDETSYAKTSYIQVLLLTKNVRTKAIEELCSMVQPTTLCIADLGCSSAELNNLSVVFELIDTAEKVLQGLNNGRCMIQEYQVYLNDLPGNDFNTVFRSLTKFGNILKQEIIKEGFGHYCFVNGAPGSFYERLFPTNHLHFVHSSYSLMWLSQMWPKFIVIRGIDQVPEGIDDNKRNIYIGKTSPPNVLQAYYEQFENDFLTFLRCRSKEVVVNGMMVLTVLGRKEDDKYSKESSYMWDLLAIALTNMVNEGLLEEEKLNTFNLPQYNPSAAELGLLIEKEGSFTLNQAHVSQVSWEANESYTNNNNNDSYDKAANDLYKNNNESYNKKAFDHYDFVRCMRSVAEPLLISHFGSSIIEELFQRYMEIVRISMAKENNVFVNVTVSLTRKG